MSGLFDTYMLGDQLILKNRVVMAPMTRTRTSEGDVPNALMAKYYAQRTSAGLIVTEATDVSAHSKGYARTPGIYTEAQVDGWRRVTDEVHRNGGTIFLQIWHVGRMAHTSLMPNGEAPWGVTEERASESDVFAHDSEGKLTFMRASSPRQIRTEEIGSLLKEFALAFKNAKRAGFDGVEIHAANGYLFDQFMNSTLNTRTDQYGGATPQTRTRLLLEVVDAAIMELGSDKVGVRLSPFGRYNSMPVDPRVEETLLHLVTELNHRRVGYVHLLYQLMPSGNMQDSEFNETHLSDALMRKVREAFDGALIWCGGFTKSTAQAALKTGWVDLIAFGRPFIPNPDLAARLKNDWPLAEADRSALYTRNGEKGYTDFPYFVSHPHEARSLEINSPKVYQD
jgi:N-ethylmaleimide reductase